MKWEFQDTYKLGSSTSSCPGRGMEDCVSFVEAAFEGSYRFWPSSWTQFLPVREAGTRFQIKMKLCCFFSRQEMGLGPGIPLLSVWASWLPVSPPPLPSPSSPLRPPPLCPSLSLSFIYFFFHLFLFFLFLI